MYIGRVKKDRVVIHWACEFIQSRKALLRPDEEVRLSHVHLHSTVRTVH
jgi:hypothetical protein